MTLPVPQPSLDQAIATSIDHWTRLADELAEAGDLAALGDGLGRLRGLRQQLTDLERHVEDHAAKLMPGKRVELDGVTLERHQGGTSAKWQSEELLRYLVGDQLVDPRTGEDVYPLLVAVLPITPSLGWRKGPLREHGVDPDEWSERKPGRMTVSVYRAEEDTDG